MGYCITKDDGLIQASLAERIGLLLKQYDDYKPEGSSEKYDATLTLVLAQALLTSCHESLKRDDIPALTNLKTKHLTDVPRLCGLEWRMVKSFYPGQELPTFFDLVTHLRDAVSHPLFPRAGVTIKETGFMAIKGNDGQVKTFTFIHSPDIRSKEGAVTYLNIIMKHRDDDPEKLKRRIETQRGKLNLPKKVQSRLTQVDLIDRIELHFDGQLLMRVFEMDVPVESLKIFVRELSTILSASLKECSAEDAIAVIL